MFRPIDRVTLCTATTVAGGYDFVKRGGCFGGASLVGGGRSRPYRARRSSATLSRASFS